MKKSMVSAIAMMALGAGAFAQTYYIPQVQEGQDAELISTADLMQKVLVSTEDIIDEETGEVTNTRYNYNWILTPEAKVWVDYSLKHEEGDVDASGASLAGEAYIQTTNRWVQINPLLGDDYLPLEAPWNINSSDATYGCMPWYGKGEDVAWASEADQLYYAMNVDLEKNFHMVCSGKNAEVLKKVTFYVTGCDKITVYFNGSASSQTYAYLNVNGTETRSSKKVQKTSSPQTDLLTVELDRNAQNKIEFYGSHQDVMLYAMKLYGEPNVTPEPVVPAEPERPAYEVVAADFAGVTRALGENEETLNQTLGAITINQPAGATVEYLTGAAIEYATSEEYPAGSKWVVKGDVYVNGQKTEADEIFFPTVADKDAERCFGVQVTPASGKKFALTGIDLSLAAGNAFKYSVVVENAAGEQLYATDAIKVNNYNNATKYYGNEIVITADTIVGLTENATTMMLDWEAQDWLGGKTIQQYVFGNTETLPEIVIEEAVVVKVLFWDKNGKSLTFQNLKVNLEEIEPERPAYEVVTADFAGVTRALGENEETLNQTLGAITINQPALATVDYLTGADIEYAGGSMWTVKNDVYVNGKKTEADEVFFPSVADKNENRYFGVKVTPAEGKKVAVTGIDLSLAAGNAFKYSVVVENAAGEQLYATDAIKVNNYNNATKYYGNEIVITADTIVGLTENATTMMLDWEAQDWLGGKTIQQYVFGNTETLPEIVTEEAIVVKVLFWDKNGKSLTFQNLKVNLEEIEPERPAYEVVTADFAGVTRALGENEETLNQTLGAITINQPALATVDYLTGADIEYAGGSMWTVKNDVYVNGKKTEADEVFFPSVADKNENRYFGVKVTPTEGKKVAVTGIDLSLAAGNAFKYSVVVENAAGEQLYATDAIKVNNYNNATKYYGNEIVITADTIVGLTENATTMMLDWEAQDWLGGKTIQQYVFGNTETLPEIVTEEAIVVKVLFWDKNGKSLTFQNLKVNVEEVFPPRPAYEVITDDEFAGVARELTENEETLQQELGAITIIQPSDATVEYITGDAIEYAGGSMWTVKNDVYVEGQKTSADEVFFPSVADKDAERYFGVKVTPAEGKLLTVNAFEVSLAAGNAFKYNVVIENEAGEELYSTDAIKVNNYNNATKYYGNEVIVTTDSVMGLTENATTMLEEWDANDWLGGKTITEYVFGATETLPEITVSEPIVVKVLFWDKNGKSLTFRNVMLAVSIDDVTGIQTLQQTTAGMSFDLQGRRTQAQGLFILNGKVQLVK